MDILSVSKVNNYIKELLENNQKLAMLAIRGEVSNFRPSPAGHLYFSLKDKDASIGAVIWRNVAERLKYMPEDGVKVIAVGRITVYSPGGRYQLVINSIMPDGAGDLAMALEQLKKKLAAEGLFDGSHKKPLPKYPKLIGVVTSPSGAVIRDIYNVSKHRDPYSRIVLYPAQVQGQGAAQQIAAGIRFFNEQYPVDVLIIGRGGGSAEDLWCFNEEPVVRAIYHSRIPVISAVGHETDTTLADYAADQRASTPSHAAELAVPKVMDIIQYVVDLQNRLHQGARTQVKRKSERLNWLINSVPIQHPERLLELKQQQLDILIERMNRSTKQVMIDKKNRLEHLLDKLELLNPLQVLRRGYSTVQTQQGKYVDGVDDLEYNDAVKVNLSDGFFDAIVTNIHHEEEVH